MTLRVFTLDYFPWVTVKNVNGSLQYGGALVDFLVYVANAAEIKFSFLHTENQTLGRGVSWTSLTSLLAKGEADLILLPFLITEDRLKKFSFSAEIYYVRVGILSGKPSKKGIDSFSQLFPFTLEVFLVFVLLLWAISVITKCSEYVYLLRTTPKRATFDDHQQRAPSVFECAWSFFAAFFSEGSSLPLTSVPSKLVASTWWLSIIVLTALVSGTMKAKYTVSVDLRVDSVQDVINSPAIRPLIRKGTAYEEYFQNSQETLKRQLWSRSRDLGGLISTADMENNLPDIVNGESVLVTGYDDVPKLVSKYCNNSGNPSLKSAFYLSSKSIFWQAVGLPLRRGITTRFKEKLDDKARMFMSTHQIDTYFLNLELRSEPCLWRDGQSPTAGYYGIDDLEPVIRLWAFGINFAILFFFLEIFYHFLRKCLLLHRDPKTTAKTPPPRPSNDGQDGANISRKSGTENQPFTLKQRIDLSIK